MTGHMNKTEDVPPRWSTGQAQTNDQACTYCGIQNHNRASCPKRNKERCVKCGSPWHKSKKCRSEDSNYTPAGKIGSTRFQVVPQDKGRVKRFRKAVRDRALTRHCDGGLTGSEDGQTSDEDGGPPQPGVEGGVGVEDRTPRWGLKRARSHRRGTYPKVSSQRLAPAAQ